MHTQLMSAPGQRRQFQKSDGFAFIVLAAAQHFPAGLRRQAQRIMLHPPAALRIKTAQRHVDQAFVSGRHVFDNRPICLCRPAMLEQLAELIQRLAMAPQHQASRRIAIQPVGERGIARQAKAQAVKIHFQVFAAFWAAMHRNSGRLVDDKHQAIPVKKARCEVFRRHAIEAIEGIADAVKQALRCGKRNRKRHSQMNESTSSKPGLLGRLFGRSQPPATSAPGEAQAPAAKRSWWQRLREGLARSSSALSQGISDIFTKRKLDAGTLEDLEDVLVQADLGVATAARICEAVGKGRYDKEVTPTEVKAILADEIEKILATVAKPLEIKPGVSPFVILVAGVNGSGKTTTIGKLAAKLTSEGKKVMLAAGDTFRAAAIEQLNIWGSRTGAKVISREQGADAAGLGFDAIEAAKADGADVLIMDTAGRLQNRKELMDELEKIVRVMKKLDPAAPHAVLLVLDATVGQNALSQTEIFSRTAGVTGLVMTKLDGTARGGILVAIAEKFALPVHFIGVGEGIDDLEPFEARDFARAIAGLDESEAAGASN